MFARPERVEHGLEVGVLGVPGQQPEECRAIRGQGPVDPGEAPKPEGDPLLGQREPGQLGVGEELAGVDREVIETAHAPSRAANRSRGAAGRQAGEYHTHSSCVVLLPP